MSLESRTRNGEYEIRWFEPCDRAGFLSLHQQVFGTRHTPEWFDWRYDSPYLDHVPVVIAADGGDVVGARSFIPFPVRGGDQTALAIQPAAAMVHPDHRRQGIFSRLVDLTSEVYADGPPRLVFNFPTPAAKQANLKMGWREVGRVPVWCRVNRASAVVGRDRPDWVNAVLDGAVGVLGGVTYRAGNRLSNGSGLFEVARHDGVPAGLLESLYERAIPDRLHVVRDREFYRWRYANPEWECTTYVASEEGVPVGAILTATSVAGERKTALLDSLPLPGDSRNPSACASLLSAVIRDTGDSALLRTVGTIAPSRVLWRYGFFRDDVPLLSSKMSRIEMVARPFDVDDSPAWRLGGFDITDFGNWVVALGDVDAPV